jgi:hypothetical protein
MTRKTHPSQPRTLVPVDISEIPTSLLTYEAPYTEAETVLLPPHDKLVRPEDMEVAPIVTAKDGREFYRIDMDSQGKGYGGYWELRIQVTPEGDVFLHLIDAHREFVVRPFYLSGEQLTRVVWARQHALAKMQRVYRTGQEAPKTRPPLEHARFVQIDQEGEIDRFGNIPGRNRTKVE